MTLPPLPKKKKTPEADITPKVIAWFEEHYPHTVALEIKVGKNKLYPHQETALQQVQSGTFGHKIRDTGKNPFDVFVLQDAEAFVVRCTGSKCIATRIDGEKEFGFNV